MELTKIEDDGERFILHGEPGILEKARDVFDDLALGVTVSSSDRGVANILYTENNRDIVLRVLDDHVR